jgi:predicted MFS family arabinose efflux permease
MKIAAGHVSSRDRGAAIGVIVGALTLGSATPHLVAGLFGGTAVPFRAVMTLSSALALAAAIIVARLIEDGPYAGRPAPFDARQAGRVLRDRAVLLVNFGYFGHMWELYAMWTWLALFLTAALGSASDGRLWAFAIIGVAGAAGAVAGGLLADRRGRTTVTIGAMAISGGCCIVSPWAYLAPAGVLFGFGLIWGAAIIADSAQFSAAVTELADASYIGTALALQTSLGFALTLAPIWSLPYLAAEMGWRFAFLVLAPGPVLGCLAMAALRRRPEALKLAAGKR